MTNKKSTIRKSRIFLKGETILIGLSISVFITILLVYLTGIENHRSVLDNSLISLSILSVTFFLLISIGLYRGLHIADNLSHKLKVNWNKPGSNILDYAPDSSITVETDDGISGILLSLLLWIVMSILFVLFFMLFEFVLMAGLVGLVALIYWLLMRALKLIFVHSAVCQGELLKSLWVGFRYTLFYMGWVYGIIYISTL